MNYGEIQAALLGIFDKSRSKIRIEKINGSYCRNWLFHSSSISVFISSRELIQSGLFYLFQFKFYFD